MTVGAAGYDSRERAGMRHHKAIPFGIPAYAGMTVGAAGYDGNGEGGYDGKAAGMRHWAD